MKAGIYENTAQYGSRLPLVIITERRNYNIMKIRVMKEENAYFGQEFKVGYMNYEKVMVKGGDDKVIFDMREVSLIPENHHEEIIVKYRDLLKIKLNREMCISLYTTLINFLQVEIGEDITSIEVLQDTDGVIRKGLWEKSLVVVVNGLHPLNIHVIGSKFGKKFDISIKEIALREFLAECANEMNVLKTEIEEKEVKMKLLRNMMKSVLDNTLVKDELKLKLAEIS